MPPFVHRTSGLVPARPFEPGTARLINSDTVPVGVMTALEDTSTRIEGDANPYVCVSCVGRMYHSIG